MTNSAPALFTGRHMLIIMLAFFGVVISANMTLVYYANHSWTGLVVKNSYVASQEFNSTTQKLEAEAAHVQSTIEFQQKLFRISLADSEGQPLLAGNVQVKIGRPTHESEDIVISLLGIGDGVFTGEIDLASGQWVGEVSAEIENHGTWHKPVRIVVKE